MGVCSVTGESSKANGVLSLLKGWVFLLFNNKILLHFLQSMRKVNEVNFIGHPFILSFEKKKNGIKVLLLDFQKEKRRSIFFF